MDTKDIQTLLEEKYNGTQSPEYKADAARLAAGEPVDYVIGWKPFLDCKIFLDSRPLIPRTETEYWVEQAISEIRRERGAAALACLDLFAGSGAIGVAVLKHLPNARIDFGEIETTYFPTIKKNIDKNHIDQIRTSIIKTDVWSDISGTYDFIFANPPYLSKNRPERIQKSVLVHEPESALFAEEDGFLLIRKTIEGAVQHLKKGGMIYLEHEPEQGEAVRSLGHVCGFAVETRTDQYGMLRYSALKLQPAS
ncbi:HemK family protein methyltransferase [Candidatus Kaiserbacteria bacterium]|nr:HemK family protein methyltransferase [Candidatus Kaiserbacteria bacterium]